MVGAFGNIFDESHDITDNPIGGVSSSSPLRPILQVLPLTLSLLWHPLSPSLLLQFLTHPVCPIRRRISSRLAETVAGYPGIGSPAWIETIEKVLADEKEKFGVDDKQIAELRDKIAFWVNPHRYDPETGAPVSKLVDRCSKLMVWLEVLAGVTEDPSSAALATSAHTEVREAIAALKLLSDQGVKQMTRRQVEKLIEQVSIFGCAIPDKHAECGHLPVTDTVSAFIKPVDDVFWWDLSAPPMPISPPWFDEEVRALEQQGAHFQEIAGQLDYLAAVWRRPVMAASKRLVLFLHDDDESVHPLWLELRTVFTNWEIIDAETQIQASASLGWLGSYGDKIAQRRLLQPRRWWRLKKTEHLGRRKHESYSSIEKFINSPYQWVLQYKADLRTSPLLTLTLDNRFKGTLAHRIIETFFINNPGWYTMSDGAVRTWFNKFLPALLEQEGALFLDSGKLVEKEQFVETARKALTSLVTHIREAKIKDVQMELYSAVKFQKADLIGYIDMMLTDKKGKDIILDTKWSGEKYRADDLRNNTHLQLAIYAYLRKTITKSKDWPKQAYFIIDSANMIAQDNSVFPSALIHAPDSKEDTSDLWRKMKKTWRWRRQQLDQGLVEITVTGTEPSPESCAPEEGLQVEPYNDNFNYFCVLTGWETDI
jgi:RecB family exonuclease